MPPPHPRPIEPGPTAPTQPPQTHPSPLLRLRIQDLSSAGARRFLALIDAGKVLEEAVHIVIDRLYPGQYHGSWPGTRSVTLILDSFEGVAYTGGRAIDNDHKEMRLSTRYVESIKPGRLEGEITGVILHEMVHCWQWNGCSKAPGGLLEGIADWVRLRAGLSPPHWKRRSGDSWNAGYEITAWFLDWLEDKYGAGTVPRLNHELKDTGYDEKTFWKDGCGLRKSVDQLWEEYKKWLADQEEKAGDEEGGPEATENGRAPTGWEEEEDGKRGENERDTDQIVHGTNRDPGSDSENSWTEINGGVVEL